MAQIVTDKFLELYNSLSAPYIESLTNIFYESTTVLDLIAKKKIAELKSRDLLKDPKQSIFPTYSGYKQEVFISNDRIATGQAVQDGYWVEDVTANKTNTQGLFFAEGDRLYVRQDTAAPTKGLVSLSAIYGSDD